MNKKYFTVGPSNVYPKIPLWSKYFYENGYSSISHRSQEFELIYKSLDFELRKLINIPIDHSIFIETSSSYIFEKILLNCKQESSFHFVNGAFSLKFLNYAKNLGLKTNEYTLCENDFERNIIPEIKEKIICITHNETSNGTKVPETYIEDIKKKYPTSILVVDAVSSAPIIDIDFQYVDILFFSCQKAFGMPAGMAIMIVKTSLIESLNKIVTNKNQTAHNTFENLYNNYLNFQTPSTPPIYHTYLMQKVSNDMNIIGIENIKENIKKRKKFFLKQIELSQNVYNINKSSMIQSDTIFALNTIEDSNILIDKLINKGIVVSSGYKEQKQRQIRISNFPSNLDEDFDLLIDILNDQS